MIGSSSSSTLRLLPLPSWTSAPGPGPEAECRPGLRPRQQLVAVEHEHWGDRIGPSSALAVTPASALAAASLGSITASAWRLSSRNRARLGSARHMPRRTQTKEPAFGGRHHQGVARHVAVEHHGLDPVMAEGVGEGGCHGAGVIGGQGLVVGGLDVLGAVARMLDHGQRVAGREEDGLVRGTQALRHRQQPGHVAEADAVGGVEGDPAAVRSDRGRSWCLRGSRKGRVALGRPAYSAPSALSWAAR